MKRLLGMLLVLAVVGCGAKKGKTPITNSIGMVLVPIPDGKAAGRFYRLPTEAEWEYACRAGTSAWFGSRQAWFARFGSRHKVWVKTGLVWVGLVCWGQVWVKTGLVCGLD